MRFCLLSLLIVFAVTAEAAPEVTIASYNLRNYLSMERRVRDGETGVQAKPAAEIEAVVRAIAEIKPDILGVCEMGTKEDFEDLGQRLKKAGLDFSDSMYLEADDDRHLALYSRYPITARHTVKNLTYDLNGQVAHVRRGFLDATVKIGADYELRLLGAHLKSKRPVPEGEAFIRRNEAELLRQHIEEILAAEPDINLLVYGDFNDTKNEPAIAAIKGRRGTPDYLEDLWIKDSVGDRWTQYWKAADLYSRFDYFFVSKGLLPEIALNKSYVFRSDYTELASDHRPIVAVLEAENK